MKRFIEGADRGQSTPFTGCLEDWIDEGNPVRVIDAFVDALDRRSIIRCSARNLLAQADEIERHMQLIEGGLRDIVSVFGFRVGLVKWGSVRATIYRYGIRCSRRR